MVSSRQIKAARYLLGWTAKELAEACDVSQVTIKRYEASHGIPDGRISQLLNIKSAFEAAGIEFLGDPVESPGVRVKPKS